MNVKNEGDEAYHRYLLKLSIVAKFYRRTWLFPRLNRYVAQPLLDVGCGLGDFLSYTGGGVGVDVNLHNVQHCLTKGLQVFFVENDQYGFENDSFKTCVLDNVLEHIHKPHDLLSELARVVENNGTLIIGVPGRKGFKADPDHSTFYELNDLANLVRDYGFFPRNHFYMPIECDFLSDILSSYCLYVVFSLKKN